MDAHINMIFFTNMGTNRSIRIPHANADATDAAIRNAMTSIQEGNVLPNIAGRRSAQMVHTSVTDIDISE